MCECECEDANCAVCDTSGIAMRLVHLGIFIGVQAENIALSFYRYWTSDSSDAMICLYVTLPIWILFSLLWIWSYLQTCWLDPGQVLSELKRCGWYKDGVLDLPPEVAELRRCEKCHLPKPTRAHHCSECNRCYFRWDHHCPVVGNCIAHRNMKAFMLFLFYSCCVILLSGLNGLLSYFFVKSITLMVAIVLIVLDIVVSLWIGCFAWQYIPEVCVNRTTIEKIAGNDAHTYDKGTMKNIQEVFGEACYLWFLPIPPAMSAFDVLGCLEPNADPSNVNQEDIGATPEDEDEPPARLL